MDNLPSLGNLLHNFWRAIVVLDPIGINIKLLLYPIVNCASDLIILESIKSGSPGEYWNSI